MDDHLVYPLPNHYPPKMDVLPKTCFQIILAWLVWHSSKSPFSSAVCTVAETNFFEGADLLILMTALIVAVEAPGLRAVPPHTTQLLVHLLYTDSTQLTLYIYSTEYTY